MSYDDWNPDDLLNFDYGRPIPEEKPAGRMEQHKVSPSKEAQLYAELRRQSRESDNKARAAAQAQAEARQEAMRQEAARQAAIRKEAERQETIRQEAERQEAMRREAARQAAIRKEAERQEAIRQEALRQEAARQAAIRKEAERQEALRQEAMRKEAARQAAIRQEAERQEAIRQEALRQEAMRREAARQIAMRREAERQETLQQESTQKAAMLREAAKEEAIRQQTSKEDTERRAAEKRRAQEEAYERYRNSTRNSEGRTSSTKANRRAEKKAGRKAANSKSAGKTSKPGVFSKILAFVYLIALAAFVVVMTVMNVLPMPYLIAMYTVLGLLSLILIVQLTKKKSRKRGARTAASILAILMIFVYGLGTAYSLGTLSFLSGTSVKNDKKVGKISEEPFNVLITGMDVWGTIGEQGRSDVNMVVTVNPKTETILMTSIPRDYEIRMEDFGFATDKLTHTGFYSTETTIKAVEDLLGININYYVKVNFDTIVRFIDAIGGLDFYNEEEFQSALSKKVYEKGNIHVQGRGALYYARERKAFLSGDNQRVKNQQVIFSALLEKATSSKTMIVSYSSVLSSLRDYFEMSFSSSEIRSLVRLQIARNPKWKMYKNTLYGQGATKPTYTGGSQPLYVTEQNSVSIAYSYGLINAVMEGKELKEQDDDTILIVDDTQTEQTQ